MKASRPSPPRAPVLSVRGVSVSFGGVRALHDVTLSVPDGGSIVGLIGPNGAGKTTLFNVISGWQRPDTGRVRLAGRECTRLAAHRRARLGLARTFQTPVVVADDSVRNNVLLGGLGSAGQPQTTRCEAILAWVGLEDVADRLAGDLSTGYLRRLELARCMMTRPRVILFDEIASGLDGEETLALAEVISQIASSGVSLVLVEHDVELVRSLADYVYVLDFGQLIAHGGVAEVFGSERVVAAYLGRAG